MPFRKKKLVSKPSLLNPILIALAVILVIGGAYSFGKVKSDSGESKENDEAGKEAEAEVKPSGLDLDEKVKNVEDVEKVIAKWIEANPRAIINSVTNMQKQESEKQMKDAQKNIGTKKSELFEDKNSPAVAPSGYDVTIVEFFDYACGYCKKAQSTVEALLNSDKKVRIIFKEFPILGQPSTEISTVAVAVHLSEPASYKKFHDALMKSNEKGKAGALKVAKSAGINVAKLEEFLSKNKDKISGIIQENLKLGSAIGVNGTPGFVIGEELIPGAVELDSLKQKIAAIRAK